MYLIYDAEEDQLARLVSIEDVKSYIADISPEYLEDTKVYEVGKEIEFRVVHKVEIKI